MSLPPPTCRVCEFRARSQRGPCPVHAPPRVEVPSTAPLTAMRPKLERVANVEEPTDAADFDPRDVVATALRQTRRLQRSMDAVIMQADGNVDETITAATAHAALAKTVALIVPAWQKLGAEAKRIEDSLTGDEMETLLVGWFEALSGSRQRDVWQKLARTMNQEKQA